MLSFVLNRDTCLRTCHSEREREGAVTQRREEEGWWTSPEPLSTILDREFTRMAQEDALNQIDRIHAEEVAEKAANEQGQVCEECGYEEPHREGELATKYPSCGAPYSF